MAKIEIPSTEGLATEDYVTRAIEQIDIPSTEGLATQSYVNESIANIKHPSVDLSPYATKKQLEDYATEEFVNMLLNEVIGMAPDELNSLEELAAAIKENESLMDALNSIIKDKANKADLQVLASKDYVDEMVLNIEIPSVEGLASEEYVNAAIAAIEVPTKKADVNVYEIISNSSDINELILLLPLEVEIHNGDIMLVTNDLGVKSAY